MTLQANRARPAARRPRRGPPPAAAVLATFLLGAAGAAVQAQAAGKAGATLQKPVAITVTGGSCESDGRGSVGANFGNALTFNIGPATVGMPGMNKEPYRGPGTYRKVIISGYPNKKVIFAGLGTVIVNPDRQSGTFATDDGRASGSWNCGAPLR
jgi:hypothetical protein